MGSAVMPDLLDLPALYRLVALDQCASTNDEAKALARAGAPEGTLVWALAQTGGRGRRGRAWVSPPGNLYCSLVLRPAAAAATAAQLSFVAAVAVGEVVSTLVPGSVKLKWPNDVLVEGAKVAGILLESEPRPVGGLDWLVLGIGINVRHHPPVTDYPCTDLARAGAGTVAAADVLVALAGRFENWYRRWQAQGFAPVRAAWLNAAFGLGGRMTVRLSDGNFEAVLVDLDADGALVAQTEQGIRRVAAGDVFFH